MSLSGLFDELRKRKVIRVSVAYAVLAWIAVQVASDVLPAFDMDRYVRFVIIVAVAGLPVAILLAWVFDITPQGIVRTEGGEESSPSIEIKVSRNSVAVLPFDNIGDPGREYFADGLAEEMINRLAKINGLHVAARTSSFSFRGVQRDTRGIGRQLGVAHILEGSVQSSTDRVRVSARLIEAKTGYHMWSERFDRRLDDVFEIQDDIANAVSTALSAKLVAASGHGEARPTSSVEAYNLYLQGRHLWHRRTKPAFYEALGMLNAAVELDPEFAIAHAAIADVYGLLYEYGDLSLEEAAEQVEARVELALGYEPGMSQAHAMTALILGHQGRWQESEALFSATIRNNPNHAMARMWYGNLLTLLGRYRDADAAYQDAYRLDPLSPIVNINIAHNWGSMGRRDAALERLRHVIRVTPEFSGTYRSLNLIMKAGDDLADVFRWYRKAAELDPDSWILPANMAILLIDLGEMELADKLLQKASDQAPGQPWLVDRRRWWYLAQSDFSGLHRYFSEQIQCFPERDAAIACTGFSEMMLGNSDRAITLFQRADPSVAEHGPLLNARQVSWGFMYAIDLGQLLLQKGNTDMAAEILQRCSDFLAGLSEQGYAEPVASYLTACIASVQGDAEKALAMLEEAVAGGFRHHWRLKQNLNLRLLHDHPDFEAIVIRSKEQATALRKRLQEAERSLDRPFISAI